MFICVFTYRTDVLRNSGCAMRHPKCVSPGPRQHPNALTPPLWTQQALRRRSDAGLKLRKPITVENLKECKESFQETVMSANSKRPRRSFTADFRQDAVNPVVKLGYSLKAATDAAGVAANSLRDLHAKLAPASESPRPPCCWMRLNVIESVCSGL